MTSEQTWQLAALLWTGLALLTFVFLWYWRRPQPYGRHTPAAGFGPLIDNRLGWILQELPSPLCLLLFYLRGEGPKPAASALLVGLWLLHYGNRTLVYPLRTRTTGKRIPVLIVAAAVGFNVVNGALNGHQLGAGDFPPGFFTSARFVVGLGIFALGMGINLWSDEVLLGLRGRGEAGGYQIPRGGLFEYVSCPNYLGEMIEWLGFAVLGGSLAALSFAVWTIANLTPRARDHHRWYQQRFANYPRDRRALVPFLL